MSSLRRQFIPLICYKLYFTFSILYDIFSLLNKGAVISNNNSQWSELGNYLRKARKACRLSQQVLASRAGLRQGDISLIEKGRWQPSLGVLTNLARNLDVSLQYFIQGSNYPGSGTNQLTLELRNLGIVDLDISHALVPGAFREKELVLVLAITGNAPDPRVVEALPYVLLKQAWDVNLFRAYGRQRDQRVLHRAAWLAEVALAIRNKLELKNSIECEQSLANFVRIAKKPKKADTLGFPALNAERLPPYYQRWNISNATTPANFLERGLLLHELSKQQS